MLLSEEYHFSYDFFCKAKSFADLYRTAFDIIHSYSDLELAVPFDHVRGRYFRIMQFNNNGSGGSSTMVLEMPKRSLQRESSNKQIRETVEDTSAGALPPPTTAVPQLQKWNSPKINIWRCLATFYCFIILGANDAAYGALIPYLEEYYNINYTVISLVFLSPIVGYSTAALSNNHIHTVYGQRGVAIIMSVSHLVAYGMSGPEYLT